jgi:hypothetical protein
MNNKKLHERIIAGIVLVTLSLAAYAVEHGAVTGTPLAHAESCTVKAGDARTAAGRVNQFGDLKILTIETSSYLIEYVDLKLKAPGLNQVFIKDWEPNKTRIGKDASQSINVCGQDVTIAYRHEYTTKGDGSYWHHIYVTLF